MPLGALGALFVAAPATAHVTVKPHFVSAGDTESLSFAVPNELDRPMTGFRLTIPPDLRIMTAHSGEGWHADIQGTRVDWRGSSLAPGDEATFTVELEAPTAPGPASLEAEQLYPRQAVVPWTVPLTVTPAAEAPDQNLGPAVVVALLGLLMLTLAAAFIWQRLRGPLQEK